VYDLITEYLSVLLKQEKVVALVTKPRFGEYCEVKSHSFSQQAFFALVQRLAIVQIEANVLYGLYFFKNPNLSFF